MNKLKNYQLSLLSAALLIAGWPPSPIAIFLFVALVPLLKIRENLENQAKKHRIFFGWTYLTMLLFNTGTTWWVWNASAEGAVMMLICNSLIMSLPYLAYSHTRDVFPKLAGLSFVLYYILFEYWHFNWSAAWPWLTLGNGLAGWHWMIQWYSITGVLGGSALILYMNYALFKYTIHKKRLTIAVANGVFLTLAAFSYILYSYSPAADKVLNVVISQPNIDPYKEKFFNPKHEATYLYPEIQIDFALEPAEKLLNDNTDILLFPETAIVGNNHEPEINQNFLFNPLKQLTKNKKLSIISGAESFTFYEKSKERPTATARYDSGADKWFDYFNSGMNIMNDSVKEIYHKSRLVPGVEKMPFAFLEKLSIDLGGTSGSLGVSDRAINFNLKNGIKVAPLICYESVFGDYANEFVRDGANLLSVMTNDGWWGNTAGYKQHLMFGRLRCIETGRQMIRSANTGVSAHIDEHGNILQQTKYNERTAFACKAKTFHRQTLYVKTGNLIGQTSILSLLILLNTMVRKRIKKKN